MQLTSEKKGNINPSFYFELLFIQFHDAGERPGYGVSKESGQDICEREHGCSLQPSAGVHPHQAQQRGRQRGHRIWWEAFHYSRCFFRTNSPRALG